MAIDGTYDIEVNTPVGVLKARVALETGDGTLSGTMESQMGTSVLSGGTVNGDDVSWNMDIKTPIGKMNLTVNATIDGDDVSGEVETGKFGTMQLSGRRV